LSRIIHNNLYSKINKTVVICSTTATTTTTTTSFFFRRRLLTALYQSRMSHEHTMSRGDMFNQTNMLSIGMDNRMCPTSKQFLRMHNGTTTD
jgi:uncharacterized membrane protein YdjX (TVP38/TMEM64 family)